MEVKQDHPHTITSINKVYIILQILNININKIIL
jgi:hypothetical protein